ncbi:MAG TPA: DNA topoisomerase 3 [Oculatellaceae cyanobacterium]
MKVILAEKPSVARDIATVVGANQKREGYFEGNDYAVTYAFGHLVSIEEPEQMNSAWGKPWRIAQLPMIPNEWKYKVEQKTVQQFNTIKKLFSANECNKIICATDAGREGEHIFRLIYALSGTQKPVERLWISTLTAEAIKDGLTNLKSSTEFDSLADAATARAHADWVVGLNFTRAYSTINNQLCTVGRVQTPTLALIVDRQKAIENFKTAPFYEIIATFEPGFIARYITPGEEPQTRLQDKAAAQEIVKSVTPVAQGTVLSVVTTEKKNRPPALYDLLTLQKDANKRFGYTAQETLTIAQSLYEEYKLISYPRTESRHISEDMVKELPRILSTVLKGSPQKVQDVFNKEGIAPGKITVALLRPKLSKTYVDDTKLTDHHAIIPTFNPVPTNLPEKQNNVYQLVALRFISIFLPAEVRDETTAIIKLGDHSFRARGFVVKDPGWTVLEPKAAEGEKRKKEKDADEESQQLPPLDDNQSVSKRKVDLKESKTNPPKPYDDGTLLTAMKNAGRDLDDEDLASYMKQKGLGTPATRAAIIERLLQTGYIERAKKHLLPTAKGRALIDQVHADLKDVALTASWEQRLADMQDGKLELQTFEGDIGEFVKRVLPSVVATTSSLPPKGDNLGPCPQCQKGVIIQTPKGAGCHRWKEGCTFTIWREQYGKTLTDTHIKDLLEKRETKLIKGLKKKDGTKYDAKLVVATDFKIRPEGSGGGGTSGESLGRCPQCKDGQIRPTPKGAGCNRWKEGCTFSVWREQYGISLTDEHIKDLVVKGRTELIKGFKRKSGVGTYDARLAVNAEYKVRLEFDNSTFAPPPQASNLSTDGASQSMQQTEPRSAQQNPQQDAPQGLA